MSKGFNIYEIMQRFWRENEYEPFSTAEIALYFFLIDRANSRRWQMPFKCPTSVISTAIQVTRQTVVNARESLSARKFITYTKGSGKGSHPMYSLVLIDELTECLTDELTETLQDDSMVSLSNSLTPYNIEDRNIKDKNYSSNKTGDVKILSLEELETLLVNDEPWLNEIIFLLSPSCQIELPELKSYLYNFFRYLRCQGTKGREEDDCRRYFVNWIKNNQSIKTKQLLNRQPMQQINHPTMLADLLVSQLSRPATTRERFRLPFSKTDTVRVLLAGVKAEVERRDKTFVMSDALLTQTEQIAEWLTGDHSKFGLMLCGGCGNGKTTFVKAFQQILNKFEIKVDDDYFERYSIRIVNARDLARVCKEDYDEWRNLCYKRMLAIDDFGTEPLEVTDYGNVLYPLPELLMTRYERHLFTILTTNLTPQEIRPRYGDRIADRLNDMVGKVIFANSTYRTP